MFTFLINSYQQALVWDDYTVDYFVGLISFYKEYTSPPLCASFTLHPNRVRLFECPGFSHDEFLCQKHFRSRQLHSHVGHNSPTILLRTTRLLNETVADQWKPVTCHGGHVTHMSLSCDTTAACWPDGDVIFSRQSDTWAIPTSESCPIPQLGPTLPPSFACGFGKQRVSYSLVCDHRRDCMDGSEEVFCNFQRCMHRSQFQCLNKQVCLVCQCVLLVCFLIAKYSSNF